MIVTIKDRGARTRDIWQTIDRVETVARRTIPGIRRIAMQPMGVDVMATSAAPVQLAIYGEDLDVLHRLAVQVLQIAEKTPGLKMAHTSSTMTQPEYRLKVNRPRAMELGLSVTDVTEQARYALQGGYTQQYYNLPNRRLNSILEYHHGQITVQSKLDAPSETLRSRGSTFTVTLPIAQI